MAGVVPLCECGCGWYPLLSASRALGLLGHCRNVWDAEEDQRVGSLLPVVGRDSDEATVYAIVLDSTTASYPLIAWAEALTPASGLTDVSTRPPAAVVASTTRSSGAA